MESHYRQSAPLDVFFEGTAEDPRLGAWIQRVESIPTPSATAIDTLVLFGCCDDLGIILNKGRPGAKEGPDSIRKHFTKMTAPIDFAWEEKIALYDYGNILTSSDIFITHQHAQTIARQITEKGHTVIALGGGHDFAAPNFLGFMEGNQSAQTKKQCHGLINIDPHLDVRPLEKERPTSGTPFRILVDSGKFFGKHLVEFGICPNRNTREALRYCQNNDIKLLSFEKIHKNTTTVVDQFTRALKPLIKDCHAIGTTFDIDSCCEAEGSSAPPVLGFSAWEMCQMAEAAGREKKVKYFEIAEVSPPNDPTERSSRIAAEMIYYFLRGRALSA